MLPRPETFLSSPGRTQSAPSESWDRRWSRCLLGTQHASCRNHSSRPAPQGHRRDSSHHRSHQAAVRIRCYTQCTPLSLFSRVGKLIPHKYDNVNMHAYGKARLDLRSIVKQEKRLTIKINLFSLALRGCRSSSYHSMNQGF